MHAEDLGAMPAPELKTEREFLPWQLSQHVPHELVEGRISPFPGGTVEHDALWAAIAGELRSHLRGGSCRAYAQRMTATSLNTIRYPDVVVSCDERDRIPQTLVLRYPRLIIEVLSESTALEDLGPKLREYQMIESLEEYVTIDSRKRWAQIARRRQTEWMLAFPVTSGALPLESVGMPLDLGALYIEAGVQ